jgi:prepilin-type N-terminal cleavage/methylation domain-containing protein
MRRGFSLVELIIAIALLGLIMSGSWSAALLIGRRMSGDADEAKLRMQMANALSDIRLRCISASQVAATSLFPPGIESSKTEFWFRGQKNVYNVTPSILTDDTWYFYTKDGRGNLVLREVTATGATISEEVLVQAKYVPQITFRYRDGFEPNFLEVTVSGSVKKTSGVEQYFQRSGARFWFVGVLSI